jgi:hypothetical protein
LLDRAEQEIKRQYINRGLYGAEVVATVTPIERNRVNVSFNVTEGEPASRWWAPTHSTTPRPPLWRSRPPTGARFARWCSGRHRARYR